MGARIYSRSEQIKVLYIAGAGRSGSTVLAQMLGQIGGFFNAGEIRLWGRGFLNGWVCECGATISNCDVWRRILANALGGRQRIVARQLNEMIHAPYMMIPWREVLIRRRVVEYLQDLESVYREIQAVTGCRVIVDPSKFPLYGKALDLIRSIDLYVLHLVRDPRAVAFSWRRKKTGKAGLASLATPAFRRQNSPAKSSIKWLVSNAAAEFFWKRLRGRYLMIRYEDLIKDPPGGINRILALLGEKTESLPFTGDHQLLLRTGHSSSGNPGRSRSGVVQLQADNSWLSAMKKEDEMVVNALTWPFLVRYGYGVRKHSV
jgi:hypothetical protein